MHDLSLFTDFSLLISDIFEIYGSFVCEVVEKIEILFCYFPSLFWSEDQVNPVADLLRNVVGLQLLPVLNYKIVGILGPFGNFHVVDSVFLLGHAKVVLLYVEENLWHVEELGS